LTHFDNIPIQHFLPLRRIKGTQQRPEMLKNTHVWISGICKRPAQNLPLHERMGKRRSRWGIRRAGRKGPLVQGSQSISLTPLIERWSAHQTMYINQHDRTAYIQA